MRGSGSSCCEYSGSQTEEEDGCHGGERGSGLEGEDAQGLFWSAWKPLDREEQQYGELSGHEDLPEMGGGALVGLADNAVSSVKDAVDRGSAQDSYGGERHGDGKKGAGVFEDVAKGVGIRIHVASLGWDEVLPKCRPDDVDRGAKAARAGLEKGFELRAVALSPAMRI